VSETAEERSGVCYQPFSKCSLKALESEVGRSQCSPVLATPHRRDGDGAGMLSAARQWKIPPGTVFRALVPAPEGPYFAGGIMIDEEIRAVPCAGAALSPVGEPDEIAGVVTVTSVDSPWPNRRGELSGWTLR